VEVIVVDDASSDGTAEIVERIAARDPRLRLIRNPPLPDGWFGKQWACANGARVARGEILCFTDADTFHSSDLLGRTVNAMLGRGADLISVVSRQELGSFWEKLIQPQVFAILAMRYGNSERVSNSHRMSDKIANGQCLFVRRAPYEAMGGHELVKGHVAEDLMLAQGFFARGRRVAMVLGLNQVSTRMYRSLGELIAGWGKNVYAGGKEALSLGRWSRLLFPVLLISAPLAGLVPALVLLLSLTGVVPPALFIWAMITSVALLLWWLAVYTWLGESPIYALLSPLGAAVLLYVFVRAIARGQSVSWKGRQYRSA
jgi:chlorobactene glucosyltransferase